MNKIDNEFVKSSYSGKGKVSGGDCVEVKRMSNKILVRDSKNPDKEILSFTKSEWTAFIKGIKNDEFDI